MDGTERTPGPPEAEEGEDFDWSLLGDIEGGRPTLGGDTKVAVYRLSQYSLRTVLAGELGEARMRAILVRAGRLAGREFCRNMLDTDCPLPSFLSQLKARLMDLGIGILRVEKSDPETLRFVVTVAEDLDCSGLPVSGDTVCDFDEGFISGIFEAYAGRPFVVREVDCWASGERTCRFTIEPGP